MANRRFGARRAVPSFLSACALACALAMPGTSTAQVITGSSLYYRLGGGSPSGGSLNRSVLPLKLGLSLRLNYSCGKFDIGLSWTNLMNNLKQLGGEIDQAVQSAIAALPMYILERAQSGLYQIFQTYAAKADLLTSAALKTCEQMEAEIKQHKDPYQEYIDMAKGMAWQYSIVGSTSGTIASGSGAIVGSNAGGGDIVAAKQAINGDEIGQKAGIPWVFGTNAGGSGGQPPIKPVHDLTVAGFCSLLGVQPTNTGACVLPSTPTNIRLVQTFPTVEAAATWTTSVLGDKEVYTCTQTADCPSPNTGTPAAGLSPRLQDAIDLITTNFDKALNGNPENDPDGYADALNAIQVPGFEVTVELMDRIRSMPSDQQNIARNRIIQEWAMHRVVNQALVARNVLISGMTVPQAAKASQLQDDMQRQVNRLTQYINDLMFEYRIRKEMTGESAVAIMNQSDFDDQMTRRQSPGTPVEQAPLQNGAVQNDQDTSTPTNP